MKSSFTFVPTSMPLGNWTVTIRVRLQFKASGPGQYATITEAHETFFQNQFSNYLLYQSPPDFPSPPPFHNVQAFSVLEQYGNGWWRTEYQATGTCGNQSHTHTWYSSQPSSITRPTITSNNVAGMWWLNGISDPNAGLYDQAQIVGVANCSECSNSLYYSLESTGSGSAILTCNNCNTTNAKATSPSSACNAQDIVVKANLDGFNAQSEVKLTVNTLYGTTRTTAKPTDSSSTSSFRGGWRTLINYNLRDLCNIPVTYPVSVNEKFGNRTPSSSNWLIPAERSGLVIPFGDEIAVWPPQPGTTQPTPPNNPLQSNLHDKIEMKISVGSTTPGNGLPVHQTYQERYIDHGDHNP